MENFIFLILSSAKLFDIGPWTLLDESFSEVTKCPACFGDNLCQFVETGDIHLTGARYCCIYQNFFFLLENDLGSMSWKFFKNLNVKNVYSGFWISRNMSVIVKKLGYDPELEHLDRNICRAVGEAPGCDVSHGVQTLVENMRDKSTESGNVLNIDNIQEVFKTLNHSQDWLSCADQNLVNYVVKESLGHPSSPSLENILTMMLINQEPLMSMTFSSQKQFPFADYLGACGRLAIFEDAGSSLSQLASVSPWSVRYRYQHNVFLTHNFKFTDPVFHLNFCK